MSERIRKGIVFGTLLLTMAWGMYNFMPKSEPKQTFQVPPLAAAVLPAATRLNTVEKAINVAEMKDKSWGDDPFRALLDKGTVPRANHDGPVWTLSGIIYNSTKPLAIINGKSVAVGDRLGNAIVMKIGRKTVTLNHSGAEVTLKIFKG